MAEKEGAAYDLGVSLGILSYHVTAGDVKESALDAQTAATESSRVESSGIQIPMNLVQGLVAQLGDLLEQWADSDNPSSAYSSEVEAFARDTVELRNQCQTQIAAASQTGGEACAMGIAIGIAEGQATDGDPARSIVFDQIGVAIPVGQSLALDTAPLVTIRSALSDDGTMQEILQQISSQRELYSHQLEAANYLPVSQDGWRYCSQCAGLVYSGISAGYCPAGGGPHKTQGSWNYTLAANDPGWAGQRDWRYCTKCQGLFFADTNDGVCPADHGQHNGTNSYDYILTGSGSGQSGWQYCSQCQGLFYAGGGSNRCPAGQGGPHQVTAHDTGYILPYTTT